ncbi:hypothetical protein V5F44_20585 [Xanthobacter sp. V2C-8]|uniref:hypothetical protein n=1 Tax=Xanthobacter albus TaxID=3119929 RepID=UPI003727002F
MLIDTASAVERIAKEVFQGKTPSAARVAASEMLLDLIKGAGLALHAREGCVSNYTNTLDNISSEKLAKIMSVRAGDEYELARDQTGGDNNFIVLADFEAAYADPDGRAGVVLAEWDSDEEMPADFRLIDLMDEYDLTAGTLTTHPANTKQMDGAPYHWRGLCVVVRLWGLSVDDMDLALAEAAAEPADPAPAPRNAGGAPRKHGWDRALAHMVAVANHDPDGIDGWSQAKIAREMVDFLAGLGVNHPTEDQAKPYARLVYQALQASERERGVKMGSTPLLTRQAGAKG